MIKTLNKINLESFESMELKEMNDAIVFIQYISSVVEKVIEKNKNEEGEDCFVYFDSDDYEEMLRLVKNIIEEETGREVLFLDSGVDSGVFSFKDSDFVIKMYIFKDRDSHNIYKALYDKTDVLAKIYSTVTVGDIYFLIQEKLKTFESGEIDLKEECFLNFYKEMKKLSCICELNDIHYANIALNKDDELKIIDWGAFELENSGNFKSLENQIWFSTLKFEYRRKINKIEAEEVLTHE